MARTLAAVIPSVDTFVSIRSENLGSVLLELWPENADREDRCTIDTFYGALWNEGARFHYPSTIKTQHEVLLALAEGWNWLERSGFIMADPRSHSDWYIRTRRGQSIKKPADIDAYQKASLLPQALLHPQIAEKAWPLFMGGDYGVSILQAFKSVEVAVRDAAQSGAHVVGTALMREAFNEQSGALTNPALPKPEREATAHLFAGAMGHIRNPHSHSDRPVEITEAARLLLFASYLLAIVDERRSSREASTR